MPLIRRSVQRTSQPQEFAGINWANPLTRGLVRLVTFIGNQPFDLVTQTYLTKVSTGFASAATAKGLGLKNTNETSYWTMAKRTEEFSGFAVGWVGSFNSGTSPVVLRDNTNTAGSILIWQNAGQWGLRVGGITPATGGTFTSGQLYTALASGDGTTGKVFVDGIKVVSGSITGAASFVSPWYLHQNGNAAQGGLSSSLMLAMWDRQPTEPESSEFTRNPWQLFAPMQRTISLSAGAVTITRPGSDVTVSGWTPSTGSSIFGVIDETPYDDADYAISPDLSAASPATMGLTAAIAAGSYTVRVRGLKTDAVGQVRINLLDSGGSTVGSSAWQALTGSFATYSLSVTTTGTATRVQIEVSA